MNTQQIQYFLSAARRLSFTAAAEEFYTSQPTVSRQIRLLEEELGFPLFQRDRQNVRLTPGGAVMVRELERALEIIREGARQAERMNRGLEGHLALGCLEGTKTDYYVGPPTIAFSRNYPAISMSMEKRSFSMLREGLYSGRYDVIFTLDFELEHFQGVCHQMCYPLTSMVVMAGNHPLAEKADCRITDFDGECFWIPAPEDAPHRERDLRKIMSALGLEHFRIGYAPNLESLRLAIRARKGVALLGSSEECAFDPHFSTFSLSQEAAPLSLVAVWRQDNFNPVIPLFLGTFQQAGEIDVFQD